MNNICISYYTLTTKAVGVGWLAGCTNLILGGWLVMATFPGIVWITLWKQGCCVFCVKFTCWSVTVVVTTGTPVVAINYQSSLICFYSFNTKIYKKIMKFNTFTFLFFIRKINKIVCTRFCDVCCSGSLTIYLIWKFSI